MECLLRAATLAQNFWLLSKEEGLEKPDVGQLPVSRVCVCVCLEVLEVVAFLFGNPQTLILEGGKWGTWAAGTGKVTRHGFSESTPLGGNLVL